MKTINTSKEVIQNQLLTALDDKTKVAILLDQDDLRHLINALVITYGEHSTLTKDVTKLYEAAFGELK